MAAPCEKDKQKKQKAFRWTDEMHFTLIECLHEYKINCEFNNIDFDAVKSRQYKFLRVEMAKRFRGDDDLECPFGPVDTTPKPTRTMSSEELKVYNALLMKEQKQIVQGYKRTLEKVKEIRQGFSKTILSGSKIGCGKLVFEHYDILKNIWDNSPKTEALRTGVEAIVLHHDDLGSKQEELSDEDGSLDKSSTNGNDENNQGNLVGSRKRKQSFIPKLFDNKRKPPYRTIPTSQHDSNMVEEARDHVISRKELAQALKESNLAITKAMGDISKAVAQMSQVMGRSMELMAQLMSAPEQTPYGYQTHHNYTQYQHSLPESGYAVIGHHNDVYQDETSKDT